MINPETENYPSPDGWRAPKGEDGGRILPDRGRIEEEVRKGVEAIIDGGR
ncbi:hypothetical protein HYW83_02430 [Candidatus Peregrinibacteria bacterium]|nr:hypothetical protein [Candidatus Peregrinibacteria bacterium]